MIHYNSKGHKLFLKAVGVWRTVNAQEVNVARMILKDAVADERTMLRVDSYFCLPEERLFTLDGRQKELDASNLVKCLHDALVKVFGVDDRYFECGPVKKVVGDMGTIVVITTTPLLTKEDVLASLSQAQPSKTY